MDLTPRQMLDLPPVWLALALALAWGQTLILPTIPALPFTGWSLIAVGVALVILAFRAFRQAKTTVIPHQVPTAVITHGVFRYSRNPIYLADVLFLLGASFVMGSLLGLILTPALVVILTRRFIEPEEARLKSRYGAEFARWSARTRRWV